MQQVDCNFMSSHPVVVECRLQTTLFINRLSVYSKMGTCCWDKEQESLLEMQRNQFKYILVS